MGILRQRKKMQADASCRGLPIPFVGKKSGNAWKWRSGYLKSDMGWGWKNYATYFFAKHRAKVSSRIKKSAGIEI